MSKVLTGSSASERSDSETKPATVLVINFGAQYAQLIARRVREARVYSEIVPASMPTSQILARNPAALILSGGPASVYAPKAPTIDPDLLTAGIPVLGICYGFQAMAMALGGEVEQTGLIEAGRTKATVDTSSLLFAGQPDGQEVWMSHNDSVKALPRGFRSTASTNGTPIAAMQDEAGRLYGVQWHPEVLHTAHGQELIERFLHQCAGLRPSWTTSGILTDTIAAVRKDIGDRHVICGLSGGVDSAVAAALVHEAVGDQLTCVFVDHGLLRQGEREQVATDFVNATGVDLRIVDARERFLEQLNDVVEPEAKRRIIGREFIREFEGEAARIVEDFGQSEPVEFLVQGTLYPDVVESGATEGSTVIKTHHNVGGLPSDLKFKLIEPLKTLFKDEVRAMGLELGLPEAMVWRQPFPGPGLAIRIVGAVTEGRLAVLRKADAIARDELTSAGLDRMVWQFPVVLLADVEAVGVQGDGRTTGYPIVLRPVSSEDAMTADWYRLDYDVLERISSRITNEVPGVNRVVLDVTSKPPGTIEWQ